MKTGQGFVVVRQQPQSGTRTGTAAVSGLPMGRMQKSDRKEEGASGALL